MDKVQKPSGIHHRQNHLDSSIVICLHFHYGEPYTRWQGWQGLETSDPTHQHKGRCQILSLELRRIFITGSGAGVSCLKLTAATAIWGILHLTVDDSVLQAKELADGATWIISVQTTFPVGKQSWELRLVYMVYCYGIDNSQSACAL
jgi:hypothetical protein